MKITIAIPVLNEEKILQQNIEQIFLFCQKNIKDDWQIIIADNNSTDKTGEIGKNIASSYSHVRYVYLPQRGKGLAIRSVWEKYPADVYCFMDADLATDLSALPRLLTEIVSGADLAIGSRYLKESKVQRSTVRKIFSLGYKFLLRLIIGTRVSDAPCGFKAISEKIRQELLVQVADNFWFFDSELVLRAEKAGYHIAEVPVSWKEPRTKQDGSRVNTLAVSWAYLKKVLALKKSL
jgi:glycosyltransferase involved in cell wall biosynthesis